MRAQGETEAAASFCDYYDLMQIGPKAQAETIQRVYHILAGRCHPDNPVTGDVERFIRLKKAYEVLSRPELRAAYDAEYQLQQSLPVEVFNLQEFAIGIDGESNRRMGLLCLLYDRRRVNPEEPGVSMLQLENMMVSAREHLLFTVWYLKDKGFARQTEDSSYAITSAGIDHVEQGLPKNRILYRLLKEAEDGAVRFTPDAPSRATEPQAAV